MVRPGSNWQTERLVARRPTSADAAVVFEQYASDVAVAKYMTWRPHRNVSETLGFLRRCDELWMNGQAFPWSLWLKSNGDLVGFIEARVQGTAVDVGYALCRRHWRQGLMSEALSCVVRWSLSQPGIFRVWATCDVDNVASARVLERVGMTREGILRRWLVHPNISDTPRDCLCYAIVKAVT
jgi:[ribosomal protein S5]-alanine N-acetyltransferase